MATISMNRMSMSALAWLVAAVLTLAWLPSAQAEEDHETLAKQWDAAADGLERKAQETRQLAKQLSGNAAARADRLATLYDETAHWKRKVAMAYRAGNAEYLEKAHAAYRDASKRLEDFRNRREDNTEYVAQPEHDQHGGGTGNWKRAEFPKVARYDDVSAGGALQEVAESQEGSADYKALSKEFDAAEDAVKAAAK